VDHPRAQAIDDALHGQRLDSGRRRLHKLQGALANFPGGTMVGLSGHAYLLAYGRARADALLTPPSTVAALRAGYSCTLHPSLRMTG
jgi:hypothetical protein